MNNKINKIPTLSKSRFMAGLQCHKRLYLECYQPELADPLPPARQAILESGTEVGALARNIYPGGILIKEDYLHFPQALVTTQSALVSHNRPPLYEAAFQYDDVRTRVDILHPMAPGAYSLIEVKSSNSLKDEYVFDAAIQYYVVKGAGIAVDRVCIARLNKNYVYPGGDYNLQQLFVVDDITDTVWELQEEIIEALSQMRAALRSTGAPDIHPGRHCSKPYDCEFTGYCRRDEPEYHISQLPRISDKLIEALHQADISDIRNIPVDFSGLNPIQQRVRDCVVDNRLFLDQNIKKELSKLVFPVHFLDFETFMPPLPLYAGTHPYEVIPFQWSNHILTKDKQLTHEEYLADGSGDPRPGFIDTLLKTLGDAGTIVVYSGYEEGRIKAMSTFSPAHAADLLALLPRLCDILPLVRDYCYHPEFHGSFSIKAVLPALVPELGYKDLEISDGGLASLAYFEILNPQTTDEKRAALRTNLLQYCSRDTEAMVRLVQRLSHA